MPRRWRPSWCRSATRSTVPWVREHPARRSPISAIPTAVPSSGPPSRWAARRPHPARVLGRHRNPHRGVHQSEPECAALFDDRTRRSDRAGSVLATRARRQRIDRPAGFRDSAHRRRAARQPARRCCPRQPTPTRFPASRVWTPGTTAGKVRTHGQVIVGQNAHGEYWNDHEFRCVPQHGRRHPRR